MRNLHPVRAQNINLGRVTKSVIFQRSFSIFGFCVNGYNSLVLRDNLNHRCWITVELSMNGVSIIWIEHVVHALMAVVDRLIVIDFGKKIAEGMPKDIMASSEVQEVYLGIEVDG